MLYEVITMRQVAQTAGEVAACEIGILQRVLAPQLLGQMPPRHFQDGLQLGVFGDAESMGGAKARAA